MTCNNSIYHTMYLLGKLKTVTVCSRAKLGISVHVCYSYSKTNKQTNKRFLSWVKFRMVWCNKETISVVHFRTLLAMTVIKFSHCVNSPIDVGDIQLQLFDSRMLTFLGGEGI